MSNATYTPGPWRVRDIGTKWVIYGNGKQTAHASIDRDGPDRGEANAHLIVTAPQMLEALRACAAALRIAFSAEGDTFGIQHNAATDALIAAERAIAAATRNTQS